MKTATRSIALTLLAAAAGLCTGCASWVDRSPEVWWQGATVTQVASAADIASDVRSSCLLAAQTDAAAPVAVVLHRAGRLMHHRAYPLPTADAVHVGETVQVNPALCQLQVPAR